MLAATEDADSDNPLPARDETEGRVYSDAALAQRQAPLTSLLPQRAMTLVAWLLAGGLAIAGIELLYARFFVTLPPEFQSSLAVFDLTARGNIANWFTSLTLMIGAALSTLVFLIRRHRLDDYRGRYRIWQWATAGLILGSLDAATGAHAVLQPAMIHLTGAAPFGDGAIWSVSLVAVAVAACLIRLAIEVRASRLATTFLCLAAASFVGFLVLNFHPSNGISTLLRVVASSATLLAAHFAIVYAVALYGRHVYQDAQGTRRASRTKPAAADNGTPAKPARRTTRRQAGASGTKHVRVDSAHEKSTSDAATAAVPTISKQSVRKTAAAPAAQDSEDSDQPMSKAERRRLRKLERRQQRQRSSPDE